MPDQTNPMPVVVAQMLGEAQYEIATLRARVVALKDAAAQKDALLLEKDRQLADLGARLADVEAELRKHQEL